MEDVIVILALAAGCGGSLVLLSCLAARRAQLVKALKIQREAQERERKIRENAQQNLAGPAPLRLSPTSSAAE